MRLNVAVGITIYLTILFFINVESSVDIENCDDLPLPNEFTYADCNSYECGVTVDKPTNMTIEFIAQHDSQDLALVVEFRAWYFYNSVIFEEVCEHLVDGSCPLQTEKRYRVKAEVDLPSLAAGHSFYTKARLIDENKNMHFCFQFRISATESLMYFNKNKLSKVKKLKIKKVKFVS